MGRKTGKKLSAIIKYSALLLFGGPVTDVIDRVGHLLKIDQRVLATPRGKPGQKNTATLPARQKFGPDRILPWKNVTVYCFCSFTYYINTF